MRHDPLLALGPWVGGVFLLVAAGAILFWEGFTVERQINLVDLATGFLTLFLAFYIPRVIERRASSDRFALDILIKDVEQLRADALVLWHTVQASSNPLQEAEAASLVRQFTNLSQSLRLLHETVKLLPELDVSATLTELEDLRAQWKRQVTGDGFQRDPLFAYQPDKLANIRTTHYTFRLACLRLIFQINQR